MGRVMIIQRVTSAIQFSSVQSAVPKKEDKKDKGQLESRWNRDGCVGGGGVVILRLITFTTITTAAAYLLGSW
jgi:hypothetical protein